MHCLPTPALQLMECPKKRLSVHEMQHPDDNHTRTRSTPNQIRHIRTAMK